MSSVRRFALIAGLGLLAVGLAGSVAEVVPASPGHDALHVALGIAGLGAFGSRSVPAARWYAGVVLALYGSLGLLGLASTPAAGALGYSRAWHNLPHLLLAGAAATVLARSRRPALARA